MSAALQARSDHIYSIEQNGWMAPVVNGFIKRSGLYNDVFYVPPVA